MSEITWTAEELAEFDRLSQAIATLDNAKRRHAWGALKEFIRAVGEPKCEAMLAHLQGSKK